MDYSEFEIVTRFSDLDSQRHVNNASYLNYIREAMYYTFDKKGFGFFLNDQQIKIFPEKVIVNFFRQQTNYKRLKVKSSFFKNASNKIICNQDIFNENDLVCSFNSIISVSDDRILESFTANNELQLEYKIPQYKRTVKRSLLKYQIRHIDLNAMNSCSEAVLWRLNEEARWNFFTEAGLSFEELLNTDIALFWIEGSYEYFNPVFLNDQITIYTWINRLDKVRVYISHEIYSNSQRILISEGQFVTVSLSRSKPIRVPEKILNAFLPFTETAVDIQI